MSVKEGLANLAVVGIVLVVPLLGFGILGPAPQMGAGGLSFDDPRTEQIEKPSPETVQKMEDWSDAVVVGVILTILGVVVLTMAYDPYNGIAESEDEPTAELH